MRFMVIIKANADSEAGKLPSTQLLNDMGKFNNELVDAGIMVDGAGLRPSSEGARVRLEGDKRTVIDGPFAETKELVAGFWIWELNSLEEAIAWAKRIPDTDNGGGEIEIRRVSEAADFEENMTPEMRAQEDRLRDRVAEQFGNRPTL